MTTNNRPTCQNCPYWTSAPDWRGSDSQLGECRRSAPKYHDITDDRRDWAATMPADWCGDHPQMPAYVAGLAGNLGRKRVEECVDNLRGLQTLATKEEETR